jgi:uncharacterized membrane protein HdeD (DUF308 family)
MAEKQDLSDQAMDAAKQLAPWKTSLPWWVVLIEGLVIGGIGLMVILDPQGANVNLALALSVGLVIAGLLQIWDIWQNGSLRRSTALWGHAPESGFTPVSWCSSSTLSRER